MFPRLMCLMVLLWMNYLVRGNQRLRRLGIMMKIVIVMAVDPCVIFTR